MKLLENGILSIAVLTDILFTVESEGEWEWFTSFLVLVFFLLFFCNVHLKRVKLPIQGNWNVSF